MFATYVVMKEPACTELDLEVYLVHPGLQYVYGLPTPGIVAVSLDVHDPVEVLVPEVDVHQHAVRQTVYLNNNGNLYILINFANYIYAKFKATQHLLITKYL